MSGSPFLTPTTLIKQRGLNLVASRHCQSSNGGELSQRGNNALLFHRRNGFSPAGHAL